MVAARRRPQSGGGTHQDDSGSLAVAWRWRQRGSGRWWQLGSSVAVLTVAVRWRHSAQRRQQLGRGAGGGWQRGCGSVVVAATLVTAAVAIAFAAAFAAALTLPPLSAPLLTPRSPSLPPHCRQNFPQHSHCRPLPLPWPSPSLLPWRLWSTSARKNDKVVWHRRSTPDCTTMIRRLGIISCNALT